MSITGYIPVTYSKVVELEYMGGRAVGWGSSTTLTDNNYDGSKWQFTQYTVTYLPRYSLPPYTGILITREGYMERRILGRYTMVVDNVMYLSRYKTMDERDEAYARETMKAYEMEDE